MLKCNQLTLKQDDFTLFADMTLPSKGCFAIIGPSGAGKSSFLNALAGFYPLTSGALFWHDARIDRLPPGQRPLSILFQDQNLFPHLTVAQNIGLGVDPALKRVDWQMVEHVLDQTGLAGLGKRLPSQLSGGQQSRAALARILLRQRPILLLDEPFAALGPALRAEMLALTAKLSPHSLVLLVTHSPQEAQLFAPETIFIAQGQVSAPKETRALLAEPPPALKAYLG